MTKEMAPTCNWYCFCLRFSASKEKWSMLENELKSKNYKKKFDAEIKEEIAYLKPSLLLGTLKEERRKKIAQRIVAFRLNASNSVKCEDFLKALFHVQKRVEDLKRFGIKDFEATVCSEFNFSTKAFSPVGQLSLPADLPLDPDLVKRLGKTKLIGFGISFEDSPLGLNKAMVELEEEEEKLSITLNSSFQSASMDKIIANSFKHIMDIARLFVVEKK